MPDDIPTDSEHTALLWHRRNWIVDQIAELAAERDTIDDTLRERASQYGRYVHAGQTLGALQPNRRFDVNLATQYLPVDQIADCLKPTDLDPAKVRRKLTPEQVEACMVEQGKPKIVRA